MRDLDGEWNVRRLSGVLPPLYGVRKRIDGLQGVTLPPVPVPLPFDVAGRELRYRGLLSGLVDHLEPDGDGWRGCGAVSRAHARPLRDDSPLTGSAQPGSEQLLDLAAAARLVEPRAHGAFLNDDECREVLDAEALDQLGMLILVDEDDAERGVVPASLQHLREESLHAAALARKRRGEEDQPRRVALTMDRPGKRSPYLPLPMPARIAN